MKNFHAKIEKQNEDINLFDEISAWQRVDKVLKNYKTIKKLSSKEIKDDQLYEAFAVRVG